MKVLVSPLFIAILLAMVSNAVFLRRWKAMGRVERLVLLGSFSGTLALLLLSLPVTAERLYASISREAPAFDPKAASMAEAVVVLRGDYPTRIIRGVEAFKSSNASRLVLSGYAGEHVGTQPEQDAWRRFALASGVPEASVIAEYSSMNTFEHPLRLLEVKGFNRRTRLCLVTSAWHMPRAYREFKRHFDEVASFPDGGPAESTFSLAGLLPKPEALLMSTLVVHERIGSAWYRIRNGEL